MGSNPGYATPGDWLAAETGKTLGQHGVAEADKMYATESNKAMNMVHGGAERQLANNRLNTSNPFASVTFNPDGSVSQQFTGGLGAAAGGLQGQAAGLANPMDWGQFGKLGTGDQARAQAIDAAYGQATSRLDPMFAKREEAERTRLLNQGLAEDSEAFKSAMGQLGNQRTDAYNQAMFSAIGQGREAGDSVFRNNLSSRGQAIQEALTARGQPLQELGQLQGLLGQQPQYSQDNASAASGMAMGNMLNQGATDWERRRQQAFNNQMAIEGKGAAEAAGAAQGMMGLGTAAMMLPMMFSDARAKVGVYRTGVEVLPGVPEVCFLYKDGFGPPGLQVGVIAQDLEKVRPDLVHTHENGFRMVDYGGLQKARGE